MTTDPQNPGAGQQDLLADAQSAQTTSVHGVGRARSLDDPFDLGPFKYLLEKAITLEHRAGYERAYLLDECRRELYQTTTLDIHPIVHIRRAAASLRKIGRRFEEQGCQFRMFLESQVKALEARPELAARMELPPKKGGADSSGPAQNHKEQSS